MQCIIFQSLIIRSIFQYLPFHFLFAFVLKAYKKPAIFLSQTSCLFCPANISYSSLLTREILSSQKRGLAHINGKPFSVLGAKRSKSRSPARFSISSLLTRENLTSHTTLALIVRSYLFYIIFI